VQVFKYALFILLLFYFDRNKTDNETANGNNKEMSIGGSGFSLHSPGYNCEGSIVLNIHNSNIVWFLAGLPN
jgi:hypothetical protein